MKKLIYIMLAALIFAACGSKEKKETTPEPEEKIAVENLIEVTFNVKGMTCEGCENAIMKSVSSLEGIGEVASSFEEGWTKVSYDGSSVTEQDIKGKIADAGYEVTGVKEDL